MRYIMLIYSQEDPAALATMTAEEKEKIKEDHFAVMDETSKLGIFKGCEGLQPTTTATTVRVNGGNALVTDGPFAETKEQLAGFYILDCENLDEAIKWASRIPSSCKGRGGSIEVRPIAVLPSRTPQESQTSPATAGVKR